jgi:hypothetical protein
MTIFTEQWFRNNGIAGLLIVEIPTVFFYLIYTSILYLWFMIINAVVKLSKKKMNEKIAFNRYLIINVLVMLSFIILIISYYLVSGLKVPPCKVPSATDITESGGGKHMANIVYLVFIAILSIITTVAYLYIGSWFLIEVIKTNQSTAIERKDIIIMTIVILIMFSIIFIVRSAVVLWSAVTNATIPLWAYVILDILPILTTLYYIYPPHKTRVSNTPTSNRSKSSISGKKSGNTSELTVGSVTTTSSGSQLEKRRKYPISIGKDSELSSSSENSVSEITNEVYDGSSTNSNQPSSHK